MASKKNKKTVSVVSPVDQVNADRQARDNWLMSRARTGELRAKLYQMMADPKATVAEINAVKDELAAARAATKDAKGSVVPLQRGRPKAESVYTAEQIAGMVELVRENTLTGAVLILRSPRNTKLGKLRDSALFPEPIRISAITLRNFAVTAENPVELKPGKRPSGAGEAEPESAVA